MRTHFSETDEYSKIVDLVHVLSTLGIVHCWVVSFRVGLYDRLVLNV